MRAADGNHKECIEELVKRSVLPVPKEGTQMYLHYLIRLLAPGVIAGTRESILRAIVASRRSCVQPRQAGQKRFELH